MKSVLFDLDGTLTDSSEGITKCAQLALTHFGMPQYTTEQLKVFIGPPLQDTFPKFGVPEDKVEEAISVFRSRYNTVGKFENRPFDGIEDMLKKLKSDGYHLFVATSKPERTAIEIMKHFQIDHYFDLICGASFDHSRETKSQVIAYLLEQVDAHKSVMIGDTVYDVKGANHFEIPTIGVSWGFGKNEDLIKEGAIMIAHSPDELYRDIKRSCQ